MVAACLSRHAADLACGKTLYGKCATSVPVIPTGLPWSRGDHPYTNSLTGVSRSNAVGAGLRRSPRLTRPPLIPANSNGNSNLAPAPGASWWIRVSRSTISGSPCHEIDPKDPPDKDEEPPPSFYSLRYLLQYNPLRPFPVISTETVRSMVRILVCCSPTGASVRAIPPISTVMAGWTVRISVCSS